MRKICIVIGTRPQIIKSQPIIELLSKKCALNIIHTGQHYDYELSRIFFEEMNIANPDHNLEVNSASSPSQLATIISKLERPLKEIDPDVVVVPGDTRSALGAAICANRMGIKVAHVEAGARSMEFDMEEEINRRMIDNCSNILFAPTMNCYNNLKKESVLGAKYFTGDTMYDIFLRFAKIIDLSKSTGNKYAMMTVHRQGNIKNYQKIKNILDLAKKISKIGLDVIFPLHPHTKKQIKSFGLDTNGLTVTKPLKYSDMLWHVCSANLLITDSGGLQKEAYWLKTPCITLRRSTEWIETLDDKWNVLMPSINGSSIHLIKKILTSKKMKTRRTKLFGTGKATERIASILLR